MESLFQNVKSLRELNLDRLAFYSSVPASLVNLSSLISLSLGGCGLEGKFPNIFQLPNIESINLSSNDDLTVYLPEFDSNSSLRLLELSFTQLRGEIPYSIGHLKSLSVMIFQGAGAKFGPTELPDSVGYLESLNILDLKDCKFEGTISSWVGNLSKLTHLDLSNNFFEGRLPVVLGNLSQLTYLDLARNSFDGQLPFSLGNNLPHLTVAT
ncbi:LRR domain containing protein [Parasponia andersonii]|uniref:LRR domain containing protein n=1 Tax=Parasponia andersonii TaxID=3476 RepID=A0A2P5C650_PARAD|nr:LRR domain containing protein [Parasponia andersonii]